MGVFMVGFLKVLLFILIIAVTINIGAADNNSDNFHGIPSYTIFTYTDDLRVDGGDDVSINVYITGAGDVDAHKIELSMSPELITEDGVDALWFPFENDTLYIQLLGSNELTFVVPKEFFTLTKKDGQRFLINIGEETHNYTYIYPSGNVTVPHVPPLNFSFKVKDTCVWFFKSASCVPPGDYAVSIILFYKNGSQWYQSEKTTTIHVNNWEEEHTLLDNGRKALLGAIAVAAAAFIWHHIAKRVK